MEVIPDLEDVKCTLGQGSRDNFALGAGRNWSGIPPVSAFPDGLLFRPTKDDPQCIYRPKYECRFTRSLLVGGYLDADLTGANHDQSDDALSFGK